MSIYDGHSIAEHEEFIFETLMPEIINQATRKNAPTEVVAFACLMALATILQHKGIDTDSLARYIKAAQPVNITDRRALH